MPIGYEPPIPASHRPANGTREGGLWEQPPAPTHSGSVMSNRHVEDLAIKLVLEREYAAGRSAVDARDRNAPVDIEGDFLIEVKAFGGPARGSDLWLESRQVQAALDYPRRFHLILVENIKTGVPHIIDIHGERLAALLERRREKRYFEVPFPTATYDALVGEGSATTP